MLFRIKLNRLKCGDCFLGTSYRYITKVSKVSSGSCTSDSYFTWRQAVYAMYPGISLVPEQWIEIKYFDLLFMTSHLLYICIFLNDTKHVDFPLSL